MHIYSYICLSTYIENYVFTLIPLILKQYRARSDFLPLRIVTPPSANEKPDSRHP